MPSNSFLSKQRPNKSGYSYNYLVETYQNLDFRADVDVKNHRSIALLHNLGFVRSTFFQNIESNQDEFNHEVQYRKAEVKSQKSKVLYSGLSRHFE
ncbi:MAG: hypothetical protein V7L25_29335 [Nostoc sp.]|uniref:hypothetical protein n=1 Tax=Nostoc sp. TaxID=1180 RepID=UPI002FF36016